MRSPLKHSTKEHSWWLDSLLIILVLGSLFVVLLGNRPLFVPDEGRYAEIGREMASRGDYITPYLNAVKYFEKPVLFYWLEAAAIKLFGPSLWALRAINACLGLFGIWFTYFTVRKLYDRLTALLAAFILGTSLLYVIMARMISLDLPVSVFLSSSLYAFLLAFHQQEDRSRRPLMWLAAAFSALAVLTKGLIGLVFPFMIILPWLALRSNKETHHSLFIASSFFIFLLIAAPWHILVSIHNPEFFYFYFIEQHFFRYLHSNIGHYQPIWYFIPILTMGFFPWVIFLPRACLMLFKRNIPDKNDLFFLFWFASIFLFFSFSKSKLIPYLLPLFSPIAILVARYLAVFALTQMEQFVLFFLSIVAASVLLWAEFNLATRDAFTLKINFTLAALSFVLGALTCLFLKRYKNTVIASMAMTISTGFSIFFLVAAFPALDTRNIFSLANTVAANIKPADEVVAYNQYYQDLPFYLKRRITIVNWRNELSYGMQFQSTQDWLIDDKEFLKRWQGNRRLFVVMSCDEFAKLSYPIENTYILYKDLNNILISNQKQ